MECHMNTLAFLLLVFWGGHSLFVFGADTTTQRCDTTCPVALAAAYRRANESDRQLTQALLAVATCQSRSRSTSSDYEQRIDKLEKSVRMLQVNNTNTRGPIPAGVNNATNRGLAQNAPISQVSANDLPVMDYSNLAPEVQARMISLEKTVNILQAQLGGLGLQNAATMPSCAPVQSINNLPGDSGDNAYQQRIQVLENSVRMLQLQLSGGASATGGSSATTPGGSAAGGAYPGGSMQNIPLQFPAVPPAATTAAATPWPTAPHNNQPVQPGETSSVSKQPDYFDQTTTTIGNDLGFTTVSTREPVTASADDKSYWNAVSQTPTNRFSTSPCEVRDVLAIHRTKQILAVCLTGDVYIYNTATTPFPSNFASLPRRKLAVPSYINSGVAFVFNSAIDENNDKLYFTVFPWRTGILMTSLSQLLNAPQGASVNLTYFYRGTGDRNYGGLAVDGSPMAAGVDDSSVTAVVYCADELIQMNVGVWIAPQALKVAEIKAGSSFQPSRLSILPPPDGASDQKRILAVSDMSNNRIILFAIADRQFEAKGVISPVQRPEGVVFSKEYGHLIVAENGGGKISIFAVNKAECASGGLVWSGQMKCDLQNCAPWAVATMTIPSLSDGTTQRPLIFASTYTPASAILFFQ